MTVYSPVMPKINLVEINIAKTIMKWPIGADRLAAPQILICSSSG